MHEIHGTGGSSTSRFELAGEHFDQHRGHGFPRGRVPSFRTRRSRAAARLWSSTTLAALILKPDCDTLYGRSAVDIGATMTVRRYSFASFGETTASGFPSRESDPATPAGPRPAAGSSPKPLLPIKLVAWDRLTGMAAPAERLAAANASWQPVIFGHSLAKAAFAR